MSIPKNIFDALITEAEKMGEHDGTAAGSWAVDGNTTEETCRALVAGIDEGDPTVLDGLPFLDLSGQWADGPTVGDIIAEVVQHADDNGDPDVFLAAVRNLSTEDEDAVIDAYRMAYDTAVQDEVYRAASARL
jgi:hypothetical protein